MQTSQSVPLFMLLTIALPWEVESQTPITCSAGQYKPGEKAYITCYYHGDISTEENTGLYITWYKLDSPEDSSGTEVLVCHSKEGAVRVCNPEEGYRFLGINKDNLTLEVPDVSAEFQGRYSCGVVPGDGRVVRPCILLVEGAYQLEKNTPRNPGTQGTLHEHVKTTHALMILTFILMTVAVAAIIYLTLAYRKRWFPFKKKDRIQNGDEERPMVPIDETDKSGSVNNPVIKSTGVSPGPVVELENTLPPKKDVDPQESHGGHATAIKKEPAGENKAETKKEKQKREKQEKEDKERIKKERENDLKERLKHANSKEEKDRIQEEYDEMYKRSHTAEREERKRIREQYDALTKGLKNATSEEDKKRIQSEYDEQKEQWRNNRKTKQNK